MLKLFLLILISSCSLFQKPSSLAEKDVLKVLDSVQLEGSGRGRLGVDQQQYLFSYDALLKENNDWILAVEIPLHGEEVMVLSNLKENSVKEIPNESFETRIERSLEGRVPISGEKFVLELRTLVRFLLADQLKLTRTCQKNGTEYLCKQGENSYNVILKGQKLTIKKQIKDKLLLELVAENPSGPHFSRTSFFLKDFQTHLSLELFWKEKSE
ncbi:MAG: hypothetical protein AB7I27_03815 [Bacteriovoracaceae bacterium]